MLGMLEIYIGNIYYLEKLKESEYCYLNLIGNLKYLFYIIQKIQMIWYIMKIKFMVISLWIFYIYRSLLYVKK